VENPEISLRNRASKTRNLSLKPIYIASETENFSYKAIGGKTEQFPYIETDSCKNRKFPFEPIRGKTGNFPFKPIA
jgi:hypothetical protein